MTHARTKVLILAATAAIFALAGRAAAASPQAAALSTPATLVYYFHANARCGACRTIEAYAHETVTTRFRSELRARRLEWRAVNVEQPANRHFIRDFRLYTRSLVVVDANDLGRFKVLERVWQLVGDKAAFQKYVEQEIRAFGRS